jgi:hypothetical protein
MQFSKDITVFNGITTQSLALVGLWRYYRCDAATIAHATCSSNHQ